MTNISDELLARLREARENAGLSIGQAAQRLGLSQSDLANIESGTARVPFADLTPFAQAYRVSSMWLAGQAPQGKAESEQIQIAARELARMKPADLQRVLDVLVSAPNKATSRP